MAAGPLSIKLRCASWQQLATIYKRDLSKGSIFLRASAAPPIGTPVRIDLALPSATVIELRGVIDQHVSDSRGAGVEVRLAPIPTGSIWLIESALASEQRKGTPAGGLPIPGAPAAASGPAHPGRPATAPGMPEAALGDGADVAAAEGDLVQALRAEAESLKKLSPFLVLGVGYDATDSDVRRAFGELTKRYHPDRFARYESSELRRVAAEIFILIRDAYRRVGDEPGRAQVLATLGRSRHAIPIPRAAVAGALPPDERRATTPSPPAQPAPGGGDPRGPAPRPAPDSRSPLPRGIAPPPRAAGAASTTAAPPMSGALARAPGPPDPAGAAAGAAPRADAHAPGADVNRLEELIDAGRLDEALAGFRQLTRRHPQDRTARAGIALCEGLLALGVRDRLEAAQHFEAALEIDPSNERAARELADMRRQATNERKGLLSRLMGKPEGRRDE
jgi:tetratricopeptide (TPR) repeat protein